MASKSTEPKLEPLILLEDEPVPGFHRDELGLKGFSRTVAGAAIGNGGPFTIGVFGGWGQGKTSVLNQAKNLLDELHGDTTVTVFFNAWQFEREKEPTIALVATIVSEVHKKLKAKEKEQSTAWSRTKEWFGNVGDALSSLLAASAIKLILPLPGGVKGEWFVDFGKAIDHYKKKIAEGEPVMQPTMFLQAFAALDSASKFTADSDKTYERPRIVVFVDDLDRCLPHRALRVLECVKLVLNHPGFIFVLGVNREVIEGYLKHRFANRFGIESDRELGRRYLDKIIQLPLSVPDHEERFKDYVDGLLQRPALTADSNKLVHETIEELAKAGVLGVGSNHTPRRLVRFINNLIIDRALGTTYRQSVDKQWLKFCAVGRMVGAELDEAEYKELVGNDALCDQLLEPNKSHEALEQLHAKRDGLRSNPDNQRFAILRRVNMESPVLRRLFDTPVGKDWLTRHETRKAVDKFVQAAKRTAERAQPEPTEQRQSPTVPAEIRQAIADAEKAPLPGPKSPDYWVTIPPGKFRMGSQNTRDDKPNFDAEARDIEMPDHDVTHQAYRIGKYPVTVVEFAEFIKDNGYTTKAHWKAGGFKQWNLPDNWEEQLPHRNRPVTGVSWFESAAYAAWAGARLPSEAEWERAARGLHGRSFPWGQADPDPVLCNYGRLVGHPTPVSVYVRGATPEGIHDLAGNVWEWCHDVWHDNYKGAPTDGSAWIKGGNQDARVLRGGSWYYFPRGCRAAYRGWNSPDYRGTGIGFRVASGTLPFAFLPFYPLRGSRGPQPAEGGLA